MKQFYFLLLFLLVATALSFGQVNEYRFNGNFNESNTGPALTEVLSCTAAAGSFNSRTINITSGTCGVTPQQVFDFNAGGGVSFPNSNTIGGTYTIHVFFKFNIQSGYRRVIDFLGGGTDVGLYTLNNCLNFYPNGNVGTCPYFVASTFYLLSLVRDGATNNISIYVNGTSFGTYSDAALNYVPATGTTPIVFFRDNIAGAAQCENADGSIKYLSVSPLTSTPAEVNSVWTNICTIALPVELESFTGTKSGTGVLLNWKTGNEISIAGYQIERSADGSSFTAIGNVSSAHLPSYIYSFTDTKPLAGDGWYRLKITDLNGSSRYSPLLKINFKPGAGMQLYPNPASDLVMINGIADHGILKLYNATAVLLKTLTATGEAMSISIGSYPPGVYILEYSNAHTTERQKLVKY